MKVAVVILATLAVCAFATELLIEYEGSNEAPHNRVLKLTQTIEMLRKTLKISGHRVSYTIEILKDDCVFEKINSPEFHFSQSDKFELKAAKTLEVARFLGGDFERAIQARINDKSLFVQDPRYVQISNRHLGLYLVIDFLAFVIQNMLRLKDKNILKLLAALLVSLTTKFGLLPMLKQLEESKVREIDQEEEIVGIE